MILLENIIDDCNLLIREKSEEVDYPLSEEDRETLLTMHDYLKNSQDVNISEEYGLRPGVGLAAVQIGVLKRMFALLVYEYDEDGNIVQEAASYALANPKILSHSIKKAYLKDGEGCLSVNEEHKGYVPRYNKITLQGYDALTNEFITIVARGYLAIVIQHELDHFDGILFYDHIDKENPFKPIENAVEIE